MECHLPSGILPTWYPDISRHIPSYAVIWRYRVVYQGVWRVHTNNATIQFSYLGILFWCLNMPAYTTHAIYMICWIQRFWKRISEKNNMYMPSTWHELLYTGHILVYPVMHQPDFESIFSYLLGSLGCLDLIGGTSQTHCMVLRSRNLINHCSDSDLRIMGISRYMIRM